jgi:hypothetical protein
MTIMEGIIARRFELDQAREWFGIGERNGQARSLLAGCGRLRTQAFGKSSSMAVTLPAGKRHVAVSGDSRGAKTLG